MDTPTSTQDMAGFKYREELMGSGRERCGRPPSKTLGSGTEKGQSTDGARGSLYELPLRTYEGHVEYDCPT